MKRWFWASASCTGTAHVRAGLPLQDAHCCRVLQAVRATSQGTTVQLDTEGFFVAVLSDGAGSASHGRQGAVLTCRHLVQAASAYFRRASEPHEAQPAQGDHAAGLPSQDECRSWVSGLRERIRRAAESRGLKTRDFACTLIMAISDGAQTLVIHVGDGAVVARDAAHHAWRVLSWPWQGEFASTTAFVTDEPEAAVRIERMDEPVESFVLFTDGMERLALNMAGKSAFEPFFAAITEPVLMHARRAQAGLGTSVTQEEAENTEASTASGRIPELSDHLHAFLDSQAVTDRTDDDKTLVVAVLA